MITHNDIDIYYCSVSDVKDIDKYKLTDNIADPDLELIINQASLKINDETGTFHLKRYMELGIDNGLIKYSNDFITSCHKIVKLTNLRDSFQSYIPKQQGNYDIKLDKPIIDEFTFEVTGLFGELIIPQDIVEATSHLVLYLISKRGNISRGLSSQNSNGVSHNFTELVIPENIKLYLQGHYRPPLSRII